MSESKMLIRLMILTGLAVAIITPSFAVGQPAAAAPNTIEADQLQQSMAIGALTLLVSRIAADRINVPRIKEFALLEVAEQQTLFDVMKSLRGTAQATGSVSPTSDAELEEHLVPRGREILQKMRGADADTNFVRDYFLLQVDAHQQLLRIHEDYLKLGKHPAVVNVAKLADEMIREHLLLLGDIKAELGAGSNSPASR
jgi:putative membrane protein